MRAIPVTCFLLAVLLVGCDPVGLNRVQLRLSPSPVSGGTNDSAILVDQPNVQEALEILDRVVIPLGFQLSPKPDSGDFIRRYTMSRSGAVEDGPAHSREIPIRVTRTVTGIEVAFDDFGFLAMTPEPALQAFTDTGAAFIKRFGRRQVSTKRFGAANRVRHATSTALDS
jgi:hypothetical protein